jgi:hypothetical protein
LTSVLFPSDGTAPNVDTPPDCFHDLRLGDIVAADSEGVPNCVKTRCCIASSRRARFCTSQIPRRYELTPEGSRIQPDLKR